MTLTEAAVLSKKVAFWTVVVIFLLVILRIAINLGSGTFRQIFPKRPQPATVAFGKLTPFDFSQNIYSDSGGVTYSLLTIQEGLPNLGSQGKVFKVTKKPPTIVYGEKARKKAANLKFTTEPQILSERLYVFLDPVNPGRRLELDVISDNFQLVNDLRQYQELLTMVGKLNREGAIRIAQGFFDQFGLSPKDFPEEKISVIPLKIEGGQLVGAKSFPEAQIVRVGFVRSDLEELPILSVSFEKPNVWVEITPLLTPEKQIFQASYFYYLPDLSKPATYPLKTTEQAFEELTSGKGVFVGIKSAEVKIRKIYLAYLETIASMDYFAPVYVFSGDDFAAFVPAVSSEWMGL